VRWPITGCFGAGHSCFACSPEPFWEHQAGDHPPNQMFSKKETWKTCLPFTAHFRVSSGFADQAKPLFPMEYEFPESSTSLNERQSYHADAAIVMLVSAPRIFSMTTWKVLDGSATVLSCKGKVRFFQEEVGEDDEFTHKNGEGEFFCFAVGEESKVEGFEYGVVAGGDKCCHVECGADVLTSARDMALAPELATVAIEGCDASEGCSLGVGQGAKFGHESDQGCSGEDTDAPDLLEALDFYGETWRMADFLCHERLELIDLFLEEGDGFGDKGKKLFVGEGLGQVFILRNLGEEMGAVFDHGGEFLLEGIGQRKRLRLECLGEVHQQAGVDLVGLGQESLGFGKVADQAGVDADDGTQGGVGQGQQEGFVTTAGFTDQDGLGRQGFEPAQDGLFGVGNVERLIEVMEIKAEFGNINSDVDFHEFFVYPSTCDTNS
jgi:hypothetical protein